MSHFRKLSSLFYQSNNLKQAVGILFVTVLMSNLLGLIRNVVIANRVGVTYGSVAPLSNYYGAFVLPDLFYNLIIVGALTSAVLPLLVRIDSEGDDVKFWQTFNTLLSTGFTVIVVIMLGLYFLIPFLIPILLPGFQQADHNLTVELSRVLLLSPVFFTISQLASSALQAKRFFLASALAPIMYNLAIISAALLIPSRGLEVLVIGVIIGAVAHFLVQLPSLLRLGWRFHYILGFGNEKVREVIKLMIPRAIALTGNQLLLLVFYRIASNFEKGSIAIYRLTDDLQTAPVLLLANTLAMAVLPDFARHIAKGNESELRELVGKALRLILFVFLPVTIFLLLYSNKIIDLYISVGHSVAVSEVTFAISTLRYFVVSLFFQGAVLLLARAYFARGDTLRPTIYSLTSIVLAWLLALLLARTTDLDVAGLALAFSFASVLNAILLWFNLHLPLSVIFKDSENRWNFPVLLFGTALTTVVLLILQRILPVISLALIASPSWQNLFEIILALIISGALYLTWNRAFNTEQWKLIRIQKESTTT